MCIHMFLCNYANLPKSKPKRKKSHLEWPSREGVGEGWGGMVPGSRPVWVGVGWKKERKEELYLRIESETLNRQ